MRVRPTLLLGMVLLAANVLAQQLNQPIPFDPQTKVGKLPNGLTYYIRKNAEPKNRAHLMLAVKVGAIQEEDPENGLAHFTEHMAFNGTKNFPKNELVSFLQSNGIKFGDDLNAFTSFEQTVYFLPVPTDSMKVFLRAFDILEDWSHDLTMDETEINKERGVILEELRGGKGASQRMRDEYFPVIMNGSKWGKRNVIGTEEILKNFKPETIRNFYKTWYQPQNQAIIAVGDFDVAQVEKIIKEKFGAIPAATSPKPLGEFPIPANSDTKVAIVTDKEQPYTIVQILTRLPELKEKTFADTREKIKRSLFNQMLNSRLQELTQKADPPFQYGFSSTSSFLGNYDSFVSVVVAKNGGIEKGLKAVLDENARVAKFGFTATELERAKQNLLTGTEKRFKEKDKTKSEAFAMEYMNDFINDVPSMGVEKNFEFVKAELPGITLEEVNALPKTLLTKENRAVIVMAPEKDKATLPKEAQLLDWIDNSGQNVTAYVDEVISKPLLAAAPKAGKVTAEKQIPEIGVTELTLSNGLKVVLKPTDFKNDEVLFRSFSFGGTSLYPLADYIDADQSNVIAAQGGVAEFSATQLKKYLTGKVANVSTYVGELTEGMNGSFSPKDAETALQLIYANFVMPRKDPEVIKGYLGNMKDELEQKFATPDPQGVFFDTLSAVLHGYNPRYMPMKPADVDKINVDKAMRIYKERFANASDFTFFFVGNFKVDEFKPLLEKYLGGLPSTGKKETYKDLNIRPLKGKVNKTVYRGIDDKAAAQLVYSGDFVYTPENETNLSAIEEILNIKLIDEIREKESGVYYIYAQASAEKLPKPRYSLSIGYGTNPGRIDELATKTLAILEDMKKNGPSQTDLDKYKIETKRQLEVQMKENRFWANSLSSSYQNGEDPKDVLKEMKLVDQVTVASVKAMAAKVFGGNLIKAVLLPEKKQATSSK
ncbi:M16 family metallopeptidase [Siphonobacter curvatus]|uniref:Peptidase M16 n=2 Tax=Siphonobacter TaxID=700450 RepID=A0A2S7ILB1_9BACT|nr:M16 family metallopeptidase [Siphonobacter curvatus]PQA58507.1 peptidase M16 [Siphonobacter curvatus]